jgi:hypothetical protein
MKGIKNIVSLIWQDLINLIHYFTINRGTKEITNHSKNLKKDGIIRIENYIAPSLADLLKNKLNNLAKKHPKSIKLDGGAEFNYRNQNNPNGADSGMLDIFFVDSLITEISNIKKDDIIKILENTTGQKVIPLKMNAYLNNSVKKTRIYHIDNAQPVIYKAFIYLSDVPDISYGPYSFVKSSHSLSIYPYINLFKNLFSKKNMSTDMPFYNKNMVFSAVGKKGDLILSSQNGIHRGLPQKEGRKRVVLVLSFMIKSKLTYLHRSAKKDLIKKKK